MAGTANPRIKLIITGGTCLMEQNASGHLTLSANIQEKLAEVLFHLKRFAHIQLKQFSNIPGEWFGPSYWVRLRTFLSKVVSAPDVDGVVVITGTDALEELSYFLHLTVATHKPLVLTASLRGIDEIGSDAPLNLIDAVRVAASTDAFAKGVLVVLNGKIYSAREVRKGDAQAIGFFSGELGPLGLVDHDGVFFYRQPLRRHTSNSEFAHLNFHTLPRVDICCAYAGADDAFVKAAITAGAKGIVVAALGSGNVSKELGKALSRLAKRGVPVVISTQAWNGRTSPIYDYPGGSGDLAAAGCILSDNLSPLKARVLLMVSLACYSAGQDLRRIFAEY